MKIRTIACLALAALLSACSPVRLLNALVPEAGFAASEGIAYGDDPRQKLDVYVPRGGEGAAPAAGGRPVVVFFYGGSWNRGERSEYKFVADVQTSFAELPPITCHIGDLNQAVLNLILPPISQLVCRSLPYCQSFTAAGIVTVFHTFSMGALI